MQIEGNCLNVNVDDADIASYSGSNDDFLCSKTPNGGRARCFLLNFFVFVLTILK